MATRCSVIPAAQGGDPRFEELMLDGQARIEKALVDLQSSIKSLPEVLHGTTSPSAFAAASSRTVRRAQLRADLNSPCNSTSEAGGLRDSVPHLASHEAAEDAESAGSIRLPSHGLTYSETVLMMKSSNVHSQASITPRAGCGPVGASLAPHPQFAEHVTLMRSDLDSVAQEWADYAASDYAEAARKIGLISRKLTGSAHPTWPLHPWTPLPTLFDLLTAVALLIDAALVPVMVAWDISPRGWLQHLSLGILVFWTCDMMMNFCTGYIERSSVIQSWDKVIKRYLKKRFLFDITLIALDTFEQVVHARTDGSNSRLLRMLRLLRFAKTTRLLRVGMRMGSGGGVQVRVAAMVTKFVAKWFGPFSHIIQYIRLTGIMIRLMLFILGLAHVIGCAWYFCLENLTPDDSLTSWRTWIAPDASDLQLYLYGLYWGVSTIFAGGSFLPPVVVWESVFSTILVLVGALFITSMTSTLAATLVEAQHSWVETKRMLGSLTAFLQQDNIPSLVLMAVQSDFVQQVALRSARVSEADVQEQVAMLSVDVRTLLREIQHAASFNLVQAFRLINALHPGTLGELCCLASFHLVRPNEEIFATGQEMDHAALLSSGQASYTYYEHPHDVGDNGEGRASPNVVVEGEAWICEIALFLDWKTVGLLESQTECELLSISIDAFVRVVSRTPVTLAVVSSYSQHLYLEILSLLGQHPLSESWHYSLERSERRGSQSNAARIAGVSGSLAVPTDLGFGVDKDIVVSSMPVMIRHELVSAPVLALMRQRAFAAMFRGVTVTAELEREVKLGKCHLSMTEHGELLRVVKLAVLDLRDENGLICCHIANKGARGGNTDIEVKSSLPGKMIPDGETPMTVIQAMLAGRFSAIAPHIEVQGTDHTPIIEWSRSRSYGMQTKYIKIVTRADLRGSMVIQEMISGSALGSTTAKRVLGHSFNSTRGPFESREVLPKRGVWTLDSDEHGGGIYAWLDEEDYEARQSTWELDASALKSHFSKMQPSEFEGLSKWRLDIAAATGTSQPALLVT